MGTLGVLLLLTSSIGVTARAAELDWEAPEGCPTQETLELRVRESMGMSLTEAAAIRFYGKVTQLAISRFRLELQVVNPEAKGSDNPRIFEAPNCEQLTDATAVAIALALGANAPEEPSGESAQPNHAEPEAPPPAAVVATKQPTKPAAQKMPSNPAPRSLSFSARLGPIFDWGSLPAITPGIETAIALGYRSASLRLSGFTLMEREATLQTGAGGRFSLMGGSLALCGSSRREGAYASLCAGLELGSLQGKGIGTLSTAKEGRALWVMPRADVTLTSASSWFGLRYYAGLGVGLPVTRNPFTLGGTTEVHRAERLIGRLAIGLEINW